MNYSTLAFTPAVRELQEKAGSRQAYARIEKRNYKDGLTSNEIEFISRQNSFYLATIGQNGYPYIQHRGGPKGFLKVLDNQTLGFVDFTGNSQYISIGNIAENERVSMILVDYSIKARLKIYARARFILPDDDHDLFEQLRPHEYSFKPEHVITFNVDAYDWNCPQHITQRYTLDEVQEAFEEQAQYISHLEKEIRELKKGKES